MRRIALFSLLMAFCIAFGLGCGAPEADPERRGNVMDQKNKPIQKEKSKEKGKGGGGVLSEP